MTTQGGAWCKSYYIRTGNSLNVRQRIEIYVFYTGAIFLELKGELLTARYLAYRAASAPSLKLAWISSPFTPSPRAKRFSNAP